MIERVAAGSNRYRLPEAGWARMMRERACQAGGGTGGDPGRVAAGRFQPVGSVVPISGPAGFSLRAMRMRDIHFDRRNALGVFAVIRRRDAAEDAMPFSEKGPPSLVGYTYADERALYRVLLNQQGKVLGIEKPDSSPPICLTFATISKVGQIEPPPMTDKDRVGLELGEPVRVVWASINEKSGVPCGSISMLLEPDAQFG